MHNSIIMNSEARIRMRIQMRLLVWGNSNLVSLSLHPSVQKLLYLVGTKMQ